MPSIPNASTATAPSVSIEPIYSEGTSKMFSCFISFDAPNVVRKPRPPPKMTPRRLQRWTSSDRPLHYRLSESESEDNYIVFDGINSKSVSANSLIGCDYENVRKTYARQRQISECSDDFICFEYDESDIANCMQSDETTDEEFTDSDDSDDESSDSDDCETCVQRVSNETNPPDSGFEEKKVSTISIFIFNTSFCRNKQTFSNSRRCMHIPFVCLVVQLFFLSSIFFPDRNFSSIRSCISTKTRWRCANLDKTHIHL